MKDGDKECHKPAIHSRPPKKQVYFLHSDSRSYAEMSGGKLPGGRPDLQRTFKREPARSRV